MQSVELPKDYVDIHTTEGVAFYRCVLCRSVVSKWDIHKHQGCAKCGGARIQPSNLSLVEKLIQIVKHPKVWAWNGPL